MIKNGIISSKELVDLFGTEKQKESYEKNGRFIGDIKKSLISKAQRMCNIQPNGDGTYSILEVYEYPAPKNFNKLSTGIYQYMAPIILSKLLNESDINNKIILPLFDFANMITMTNKNYKPAKYNQACVGEFLDINQSVVAEFFDKVDYSIRYYIESCLNYLKTADVLEWYKVPMVKKRKMEMGESKDGVIPLICERTDERASDEEVKYIIDCREQVKDELKISNRSECFYGSKAKKYKERLQELLKIRDILYFYESYEVFYTNIDRCKALLSKFDETDLIANFNRYFIDYILENARGRQLDTEVVKKYRLEEGYLSGFNLLSAWTIDSKQTKNIREELGNSDSYNAKLKQDFDIMFVNKKGEIL